MPTWLIDLTLNSLVAFCFAAKDHWGATGEIIVFRVNKDKVYVHSSIANLANLSIAEDFNIVGEAFHWQRAIHRLIQFIRDE